MRVICDPQELPETHHGVLVPTMGALHEGHLALIRRAALTGVKPLVISIFVNPTQFGPGEDFVRYPRSLDEDIAKASEAGGEIVFAPEVETMYPPHDPVLIPPLPNVATQPGLEDAHRPGHFKGVCQVVARLFDLVRPRVAVFGEKDYQQLLVMEAMVEQEGERWGELEITRHETIRETDGLAMSSRNAYLKPENRERALGIYRALQKTGSARTPSEAEAAMRSTLDSHDHDVEYAVIRDAATLMPVSSLERPARALIAARVADVRLIDNGPMPVQSG